MIYKGMTPKQYAARAIEDYLERVFDTIPEDMEPENLTEREQKLIYEQINKYYERISKILAAGMA
jgi:hypothetical protein